MSSEAHAGAIRSRWAWLGWVAAAAAVATLIALLVVGLARRDSAGSFGTAVVDGARPPMPEAVLGEVLLDGRGAAGGCAGEGLPADCVLVVNFWASWCTPCATEAPELEGFDERMSRRGVRVVGLDAQDSAEDARAFVDRHSLQYRVVRVDRQVERAWGVRGFPETFVVGRDGRVSARIDGPVDVARLQELVDDELRRKA